MKQILQPFQTFATSGSASGLLLMVSVVLALIIANSPLGDDYANLLTLDIGFNAPGVDLKYPLLSWVNDGLMAIFFLMVGLEIKRELVEGELASFQKATLPIMAALGGVVVPALIYILLNQGSPTAVGWGIPMATDIAFALAIITLLGKRVPLSVKVFLTALAIVDDLTAILVIAVFYTTEIHLNYLGYAAVMLSLLVVLNRLGVKALAAYLIPGALMWYFAHHSGIHATIAGVLTALTIPISFDDSESPLLKLEHALEKPVNFIVLPLFALANTNISFGENVLDGLWTPMSLGIILGLLVGKPLGIALFSWIAVRTGLGTLPSEAGWGHILGAGILGGIGFTMSIFIALLSFPDAPTTTAEAKFAVLSASFLAGLAGFLLLNAIGKRNVLADVSSDKVTSL